MTGFVRLTAAAASGLFAWGLAAPASALTLEFSPLDVCGAATCSDGTSIPQSYGDIAGKLDVTYDSEIATPAADNFFYWASSYSGHSDVAYANLGATGRITLEPMVGYAVTLQSFFIGSYVNIDRSSQITVSELGGGALLSTGAITIDAAGSLFSGPWTSTAGIVIEFGPDAYNVGIDDITYSVASTAVATPLPASAALLAGGIALLGAARRRRAA